MIKRATFRNFKLLREVDMELGALNVIVSFYLAFHLALRAHNVARVDRRRIYRALRARWRHAPLSFFAPTRGSV